MGWVAARKQKIRRDGKYIQVFPGDPIPEADFWPNLQAHIDQHYVRWDPRDAETMKSVKAQESVSVSISENKSSQKRGRPKKNPEEDPKTLFVPQMEE